MLNIRIESITKKMKEMNLDYFIISDPISIFYGTGINIDPGERLLALLINKEGELTLFLNKLFTIKLPNGIEAVWHTDIDEPILQLAEHISGESVVGIDKNWPSRFLIKLWETLPNVKFKNGSLAVDEVRMQKDSDEKEKMIVASQINDEVMDMVQNFIYEGVTELDVIDFLNDAYKSKNTTFSFHPIVCFGENAANPHHESGDRKLKSGDSVIIDIGCKKDNYCSDMTRTIFYESVTDEETKVYNLVKKANLTAIEAVKPGVRFCDIDKVARKIIEDGGYGDFFLHRTGHSIGLEVHDHGDVSSINENVIKEGMIFSIEPGIYLENKFGVRIEDLVLVTENGCRVLNTYSKELKILSK